MTAPDVPGRLPMDIVDAPHRLVEAVAGGILTYFRAVAVDYDGTLANGRVAPDTLSAVDEARARGIRIILVTGRIMSELRTVFPDVDQHVDAIVAENGGTLITAGSVRQLAPRVDPAVSAALLARGVTHRRGQVLVACAAADAATALDAIHELGLDCQLVHNRNELMILPAGVTKGSGLLEALADLRLSPHNTIGVGDAENDHSLLDACEIGVAVANAVEAIREHADVTLDRPGGQGVADLLRGPLLTGHEQLSPSRRTITLGTDDEGDPISIPASQLNVAICGGTGAGKSYLAGAICEQLVRLRYSVVVFDPEGDHVGLAQLGGVIVTGGEAIRLLAPRELIALLRHRDTSVVVDASHLEPSDQARYLAALPREIEAQRAVAGLPQWVVVDEADSSYGRGGLGLSAFNPAAKGYLLVTWRPEELAGEVPAALDAVIGLTSSGASAHLVALMASVANVAPAQVARALDGPPGRAVLAWRGRPNEILTFTPAQRATPHFRHEHKYARGELEPARRFHFRTYDNAATGGLAANLAELEAQLSVCDRGVLRHHCPGHEFSRWISGVFHDQPLAANMAAAESQLQPDAPAAVVEQVRLELIAILQTRRYR